MGLSKPNVLRRRDVLPFMLFGRWTIPLYLLNVVFWILSMMAQLA
jgi:hypothetical protein